MWVIQRWRSDSSSRKDGRILTPTAPGPDRVEPSQVCPSHHVASGAMVHLGSQRWLQYGNHAVCNLSKNSYNRRVFPDAKKNKIVPFVIRWVSCDIYFLNTRKDSLPKDSITLHQPPVGRGQCTGKCLPRRKECLTSLSKGILFSSSSCASQSVKQNVSVAREFPPRIMRELQVLSILLHLEKFRTT